MKTILKIIGTNLALLNVCASYCKERNDKPNVVLILIDDMGWRDIGCCGSSFYETPNIDALAQNGVRFTQAYAACHVSSPARASLLTGMYPASLGLTDWLPGRREYPFQKSSSTFVEQDLPHKPSNIAQVMHENGYATALIGKWHLGEGGATPEEYGFDIHIPHGYLRGWPDTYYAPFNMNGYNGEKGEYLTDKMTDEAVEYIHNNSNKPFFLLLSHFATHDPIEGRKDLVEKYRRKLLQQSRNSDPDYILEGNPDDPNMPTGEELLKLSEEKEYLEHKILPHSLVKIKQRQDNINFAAMVESVDESVGRVKDALREEGLLDNTILIFFSDNGGMSAANYGNPNRIIGPDKLDKAYSSSMLPLRGGKGWMYEGGLRVPLIVSYPHHCAAGDTCSIPVSTPDILPTIASLTGITTIGHRDGIDFSPLLNKGSIEDRSLYWHFPHYSNHGMQSPCGAIRKGDYKLIEYYDNGTLQLFNISKDPQEQHNIAREQSKLAISLKMDLHRWRKTVGAQMPPKNKSFSKEIADSWYSDAVPVKYWACQTSHRNYGKQGSEVSFLSGCVIANELHETLARAIRDVAEYKKHGYKESQKAALGSWGKCSKVIRSQTDETSIKLWNILCSLLYDITCQGVYLDSIIRPIDGLKDPCYKSIALNHIAGEFNNNLEILGLEGGKILPGKKFGNGIINVETNKSQTKVSLTKYTIPHTYATYSINIFVGVGNDRVKVTLNRKGIPAKANSRGFISIKNTWQEGDEIIVLK